MAHTLQLYALDAVVADSTQHTYTAQHIAKAKPRRRRTTAARRPAAVATSASPLDRLASLSLITSLASIYSGLLEETVTPRRTLSLVHAQVAVISAMLPVELPLSIHVLLVAWAVAACYGARK